MSGKVHVVDGSSWARAFSRFAALVVQAMCSAVERGHMTLENALADQGSDKSSHSRMLWHKWVVMIADRPA